MLRALRSQILVLSPVGLLLQDQPGTAFHIGREPVIQKMKEVYDFVHNKTARNDVLLQIEPLIDKNRPRPVVEKRYCAASLPTTQHT